MPAIETSFTDGDLTGNIKLTVIAQVQERSDDPVRKDFRSFNSEQTVFLSPEKMSGTITFFVRVEFQIFQKNALSSSMIESGLSNYRCTYEYEFGPGGGGQIDAKDLRLSQPVTLRDIYTVGNASTVGLASFNPDIGPVGHTIRYIRITPALAVKGFAHTRTIEFSAGAGGKGLSADGTFGIGLTETPVPTAVPSGTFKLNVFVYPLSTGIEMSKPFRQAMALRLTYSEKEVEFNRDRQLKVLAWIKLINQRYPSLAEAVRRGGPLLHIDGYASITGTPLGNQGYALQRINHVKQFVATHLAVPVEKISPKPFGSQNAQWHWEFESPSAAKKLPRDEDRAVIIWFDANEAWRIAGYE